jgi:hypothetical protein
MTMECDSSGRAWMCNTMDLLGFTIDVNRSAAVAKEVISGGVQNEEVVGLLDVIQI